MFAKVADSQNRMFVPCPWTCYGARRILKMFCERDYLDRVALAVVEECALVAHLCRLCARSRHSFLSFVVCVCVSLWCVCMWHSFVFMFFLAKIYGICNMDYLWSEVTVFIKSRVIRGSYTPLSWPRPPRWSISRLYGPDARATVRYMAPNVSCVYHSV